MIYFSHKENNPKWKLTEARKKKHKEKNGNVSKTNTDPMKQ